MSDKPQIKVIKQGSAEAKQIILVKMDAKRLERERRAEITLLEILIERYPDNARQFVRKLAA